MRSIPTVSGISYRNLSNFECLFKKKKKRRKKSNIKHCFITVTLDFQGVDEDGKPAVDWLCQTWRVGPQEPVEPVSCSVAGQEMVHRLSTAAVLPHWPSHALVSAAVRIHSAEISRTETRFKLALSIDAGRTAQVGPLKSHYVVCTVTLIVRLVGVNKILWP